MSFVLFWARVDGSGRCVRLLQKLLEGAITYVGPFKQSVNSHPSAHEITSFVGHNKSNDGEEVLSFFSHYDLSLSISHSFKYPLALLAQSSTFRVRNIAPVLYDTDQQPWKSRGDAASRAALVDQIVLVWRHDAHVVADPRPPACADMVGTRNMAMSSSSSQLGFGLRLKCWRTWMRPGSLRGLAIS